MLFCLINFGNSFPEVLSLYENYLFYPKATNGSQSMSRLLDLIFLLIVSTGILFCQQDNETENDRLDEDDLKFIVFWEGTDSTLTLEEVAAYCAPIFWYSPDESELGNKKGKYITIPAAFPFQGRAEHPVVYCQVRQILAGAEMRENSITLDSVDIGKSIVDLSKIVGFTIDYNHYYEFEVGLGKHTHDTEQAQFKIYVHRYQRNGELLYQLYLIQSVGKAHALMWYDHIYNVNIDNLNYELKMPFHILVEEGKHASITDMNGDGYYTPGYDVSERKNDAWGLRDIIRTGDLFSAEFKSWMAKVRRTEHRVFPPLPEDSPQRERHTINGEYAPYNAIYELRPMPAPEKALPDEALAKDMKGYFTEGWPQIKEVSNSQKFYDWWEAENFIKSIGVAFRYNDAPGITISFPLFIVKNIEAPLVGGWLVNRIYLQDKNLRDFGYGILYTPSASRFMDPYFFIGFEIDKFEVEGQTQLGGNTDFVFETRIKMRGNVKYSAFKFLGFLTDFWGVRFGIKNKGIWAINNLDYVFEIGAGVWYRELGLKTDKLFS